MDLSRIFKNKKGEVVVAQKPNASIYIALFFYLIRYLPKAGVYKISYWGVAVTMFYWSYLEIVSGESPFRRILGIVVASYLFIKISTVLMV